MCHAPGCTCTVACSMSPVRQSSMSRNGLLPVHDFAFAGRVGSSTTFFTGLRHSFQPQAGDEESEDEETCAGMITASNSRVNPMQSPSNSSASLQGGCHRMAVTPNTVMTALPTCSDCKYVQHSAASSTSLRHHHSNERCAGLDGVKRIELAIPASCLHHDDGRHVIPSGMHACRRGGIRQCCRR